MPVRSTRISGGSAREVFRLRRAGAGGVRRPGRHPGALRRPLRDRGRGARLPARPDDARRTASDARTSATSPSTRTPWSTTRPWTRTCTTPPPSRASPPTWSASLAARFDLAGKVILDIGCGQGEFLRELCHEAGATGFGYDAMYAGVEGPDPSGAHFTTGFAPLRDPALPDFDVVTSRHWFEHIDDPYDFLVALRERAGDRPVYGYFEVPDAGYDLATAGWEVIYPHVSYFDVDVAAQHLRAGRLAGRPAAARCSTGCSASWRSRRTRPRPAVAEPAGAARPARRGARPATRRDRRLRRAPPRRA